MSPVATEGVKTEKYGTNFQNIHYIIKTNKLSSFMRIAQFRKKKQILFILFVNIKAAKGENVSSWRGSKNKNKKITRLIRLTYSMLLFKC